MRAPVPGLTLSAGWSKATGFELDILLPSPTTLSLGNGVSTTPIKLQLQTRPLNFILSAGLKVPVPHSPTPLLFTLSLAINLLGASAAGEMAGLWVNPFGISPHVSIGPDLLLAIEIIYAQFAISGTPRWVKLNALRSTLCSQLLQRLRSAWWPLDRQNSSTNCIQRQ